MPFTRSAVLFAMLSVPLPLVPVEAQDAPADARMWAVPSGAAAEALAAKTKAAEPAAPKPKSDASPVDAAAPVPPAPVPAKKPGSSPPASPVTAIAGEAQPAAAAPAPSAGTASPTAKAPDAPPKAEVVPAKGGKVKKPPPTPAKELFGAAKTPAPLAARAIGWYAKGCLAGAKPLAIDGPAWQVMRLSRNRMWGHPDLIALVERLAADAKDKDGWPGLLIGDIAQPRGGPMTSGHASHQVGLDADVWLTPMPDHRLTEKEREDISATSMLAADDVSVDPQVFGEGQVKLIKRAASYRQVERVLVHPAIKKALCLAAGTDRDWLAKVRPYWGHYYHMHIRISCPKGSTNCRAQPAVSGDDGCGAEIAGWLKKIAPPKTPPKAVAKPEKPEPKKPDIMLADLPTECRTVLAAGESTPATAPPTATSGTAPNDAPKGARKKTAARK